MARDYADLKQDITAHSLGKILSAPGKKAINCRDLSDDLVPLVEIAGRNAKGRRALWFKGQGHRTDSEPTSGNDYEPMGSATSKRFVNRLNGLRN